MVSTSTNSVDLRSFLEGCALEPYVFDGVCAEICPALAEIILARMQSDRSRKTGSLNVGGWKSGEDFLSWPDAPVQQLRQALMDAVGGKPLVGWAMVNRAGSQHPRHQHRIAIVSGIYYVTSGNTEAMTPTVFECPCDARQLRSNAPYEMKVDPHPGRLVVFRGETWHRVPLCMGDTPRITVAFDARR